MTPKTAVYPISIHSDPERPAAGYGVLVPDLPGCVSAGDTYAEAMEMAQEAIEGFIQLYVDDGDSVPPPTTVDRWANDPEYQGDIWAVVQVRLPAGPRAGRGRLAAKAA